MNSLKIGSVIPSSNVFLAPMAGVTEIPVRLLAKEHSAGLVYTGMVNARGVMLGSQKSVELATVSHKESPVAIQLYGSDPEIIACAAQIVEPECDLIDLNFGCPAHKVIVSGYGAALLKEPMTIREIVTRVARAVDCPVTVKIRSGWNQSHNNAIKIAKICQDSGAAAITIHPRTCAQGFEGAADWRIIAEVKDAVSIPVIGNGDITSPEDVTAMFESTGCDAVMIGRASLGNLWIFSRTVEYLKTGVLQPEPTRHDKIQMFLKFTKSMVNSNGEYITLRKIRTHVKWYVKGFPDSSEIRQRVHDASSYSELEEILAENGERKTESGELASDFRHPLSER